jgi:molybdenum cofactor biosynthesis enzyme MoaA
MITLEIWARGYADETGLTRVRLPLDSTPAEIHRAVRKVGMFAQLAGVRRASESDLTAEQIAAYTEAYRGDNT